MADRKFTFLEVHLNGDVQFGPGIIGGSDAGEVEIDESESGGSRRPSPASAAKAVAGIGLVVLGVVALRRLAGDRGPEGEPVDLRTEEAEAETAPE